MENMNLSDKSKEALKSETWQEVRTAIQKKQESGSGIRHRIVEEYLKEGYGKEKKPEEVFVSGEMYKIMDKGEITTFYDADGNTLFHVENAKLEEMNGKLVEGRKKEPGKKPEENPQNNMPADNMEVPDPASVKQMAKEKLEKEMKADKDKTFAEPVIGYLLKRCEDDLGLAQDVVQEHKTWEKCFDYIYSQARKQKKGNCAAVRDDVVYEWAEDYYHRDDKAEEEQKAREAAERRKKETERKKKATEQKAADKKNLKPAAEKANKVEEKLAEPQKPRKNSNDMDGQMDLFSMMGMQGAV